MIFPQSFPAFYSLGLVTLFCIVIFFWRYQVLKKKIFEEINLLPSILIFGSAKSGKTTLLLNLTNSYPQAHPVEDGLNISSFSIGGKKIQLIEVPTIRADYLKKVEKMNFIGGIYIFDISKDGAPIEEQIENFKLVKEFLKDKGMIIVANKLDIVDEGKIEKLKDLQEKIHMISMLDASKRKELEDVLALMKNLPSILEKEKSLAQP